MRSFRLSLLSTSSCAGTPTTGRPLWSSAAGVEPTREELAIMAQDLKADSLVYLPLESVAKCIGLPAERLCRACITGEYPTESGTRRYELELAAK